MKVEGKTWGPVAKGGDKEGNKLSKCDQSVLHACMEM
jgi:hypothetical protein